MINSSNFSETLSELLEEHNLTTDELGKVIGVSGATIRNWKLGTHKLNLSNAVAVCDYFECSLEFLVGRTDKRLDFKPRSCLPFYERLMQVMKEQNKSRYRIVKDTAFSNGYFSRWKNGADPLLQSVIDLAKYFDCTLDYLVGRE